MKLARCAAANCTVLPGKRVCTIVRRYRRRHLTLPDQFMTAAAEADKTARPVQPATLDPKFSTTPRGRAIEEATKQLEEEGL
jgi:hypothetical protein